MNNIIKNILQCGAVAACISFSSLSHADIKSMTKVYNNPASAPKVTRCKGNINCNAFFALSKEWQVIPKNYKLDGYKLRSFIEDNDGDSLNRGFAPPYKGNSSEILDAGAFTFKEKARNDADFLIFVKGLAVLHYIDRSQ